jgi:hypothetical protein
MTLIEKVADFEVRDKRVCTSLHYAGAEQRQLDEAGQEQQWRAVSLLLPHVANPEVEGWQGRRAGEWNPNLHVRILFEKSIRASGGGVLLIHDRDMVELRLVQKEERSLGTTKSDLGTKSDCQHNYGLGILKETGGCEACRWWPSKRYEPLYFCVGCVGELCQLCGPLGNVPVMSARPHRPPKAHS